MAYKMKGFGGFGNSPAKQKGPINKENPKLQPSEMEGTYVYKGDDMSEREIDLDERISFIEEDMFNDRGDKKQQNKDLKKLKHERDIISKRRSHKKVGTGTKPGYTDGKRDKSKDKIYGIKGPLGVIE